MWWIVASLIFAGIVFMLVETLLTPGVGVAGVLSLGSFGTAVWYAFSRFSETAGWITLVACTILLAVMTVIMLRSRTWKRLELSTEIDSKVNSEFENLREGDRGETVTRLAPLGTARFGEVSCEVKSADNTMVAAGTSVEITRIADNKVEVKQIKE